MKNHSRVIIMTVVLLIGVALWLPGLRSRRVAAQSAGLTGSYGVTLTALDTPIVNLGVFTFDGAGNVSASFTNVKPDPNPNATTVQVKALQLTGSYTVNADGTGTVTLPIPGGQDFVISFVITDGGSSLMLVVSGGDPDVVTGTARRQ
jgi:hypothetical protein